MTLRREEPQLNIVVVEEPILHVEKECRGLNRECCWLNEHLLLVRGENALRKFEALASCCRAIEGFIAFLGRVFRPLVEEPRQRLCGIRIV
jgi:hypothetical protein